MTQPQTTIVITEHISDTVFHAKLLKHGVNVGNKLFLGQVQTRHRTHIFLPKVVILVKVRM